jgi:hypothetical protein
MTTLHCAAGCGQEFTGRDAASWRTLHYGVSDCASVIYGDAGAAVRKAYVALMDAHNHGDHEDIQTAANVLVALLRVGESA